MKVLKRAVSVFLAVLMILSSMSAFASLNDGLQRTLTSRVVFYRMNADGDWEETVKVSPGDHIQARIILQTDFIAGEHSLYYLFSKDVLELDTDVDPGNGSSLHVCDGVLRSGKIYVTGDASGNADSEMQIMINDGYLDSSVEDNFGGIWLISNGGYSSIFDGVTELYTIDFLVKDDAPEGSVATMFLPTETRRQTRATTPGFSHLYTYSAKVKSADDNNKKLVEIADEGASNPQDWDSDFEVYNLASANINTIGTEQGLTAAEITSGTTVEYGAAATDTSSFIQVSDSVEVRYWTPSYTYDSDLDQSSANWEVPDESTTGTGTRKKYFYDQSGYDTDTKFLGMTSTPSGSKGNLQMIPEGYYFAGWMPIEDPDDGFDVTAVTASDVAVYNSVMPAITDTAAGTSLDYSGLDGKTAAQGGTGDPDEVTDMLIADPASATLNRITDSLFGSYITDETDDDGNVTKVLNVVAVVLPVPTDVTVRDITVPGGTTLTGSTFTVNHGAEITEADVDAALTSAPAAVDGYTFTWYVEDEDGNTTELEFPYTVNGTTTVIGEYEKITYTVRYMYGETEIESFDVIFEDEIEVTGTDPEKAGYTFTGWLDADGNAPEDYDSMPAKNLVFNAQFTPDDQTITYYLDNAATGATSTAKTDAAFTLADLPEKAGYTVTGWTLKDADGNVYTGTTMPAGGLNAYATSTADDQTVTYIVDGTEYKTESFKTDAAIVKTADPTKAGYTFHGWYTDNTYAAAYTFSTMPAGGVTVYGYFTADDQAITYYVDGTETALTPDSAKTDAAYTLADLPAKAGYTYTAWEVKDSEGNAYSGTTMPAGGLKVYTTSSPDDQNLEYYVDGVKDDTRSTTVKTDAAYTLADLPAKAGYTYTAWEVKKADDTAYSGTTMPAGGLKIYTTSSPDDQDLEYYVDGVKDDTRSTTVKTDAAYTLADLPTKAGYTYSAWEVKKADDTAYSGTTMPAGGLKAYTTSTAVAQPITYKVDGVETALTPATADTDADITLAALPTKAGYTYTAWTLENGNAVPAKMPAGGITVVTISNATEQTITYKVAGETDKVDTYATDATVTAYAPTKAGYTFDGWYTDDTYATAATVPGTMPAIDVVLYGHFVADAQPITYKVDGTVTALTPATANTDESIVLAAKPEKAGYSYTDWTLEGGSAVPATMPAGGITVVSTSTALPQTITYIVDGTEFAVNTFNTDETIARIADPSKDGYTFHGWYTDNTYADSYTFGTMPAGGVTVYGYFTADAQNIIYVVDGKVVSGLTPASANTDETVTLAALPEKAGYSYSDWALSDGTAVPAQMPAGGITVYTTSTALDQTITYKVDGTVTALEPSSAKTDAAFTLAAKPSKDGYSYTAWAMEDGSDIPAQMPAGGIVVVSTSTALDQDLEYYVDGELTKTDKVKTDADYTLDAVPTKAGYSYTAWKLADDTDAAVSGTMPYGGIKVYTTSTALDQDLEYYVDGTLTKTDKVKTDADYTLDAVPTKAGYEYTEWKLADDSVAATTGKMTAEGLKVYTTSAALDQDLEYYVNGELTKTVKVKTDADYTLDAVPTKAGYTYTAWKNADDTDAATSGTMPAGGIKVYTTSTADMQPITYKVDGTVTALTPAEAATNADVVLAAVPTKAGYTYSDWTLEDGSAVPGKMPVGGITVVSNGTAEDQLITYKVDGKEVTLTPNTFKTDETITLAAKPEKTGYTYSDWTLEDGTAVPAAMPAGGITVVSDATVNKYLVTINNEDGTEISSAELDYGTAIPFPTAAEMNKDGYNFLGWNGSDGSAVAPDGSATVPAYGITYTAEYSRTAYTVTIRLENLDDTYTETTETRYAATGDTVSATDADKTATGYVVSEDDSTLTATVAADGSTALVVTLNREVYTLYLVVDHGEPIKMGEARYGDMIPVTAPPTKTGYLFHGYYMDSDYTQDEITLEMPAEDMTIYGYFTVRSYRITYVTDGSELEPALVTYGDNIPSATTSKDGYWFTGWTYTDSEGNEYTGATMPAYPLTATANFQVATYTVSYYVDGRKVAANSQNYGTAINYEGIYKPEDGMKLDGWYSDADCTIKTTVTTMPAYNVSVYAKTVEDDASTKEITFDPNGGSWADGTTAPKTVEIQYNEGLAEAITALGEEPVKTGSAFSSWSLDGEDTYAAVWTENAYTVTCKNGDNIIETFTVAYGDDIEVSATVPEKAGYNFTGWADEDGNAPEDYAAMPAENVVFFAQFEAAEQPITYMVDGVETALEPSTALTDGTVTLAALPEKAGYNYTAWTLDDGSAVPETMPAGGITVVTFSNAADMTITYKVDDAVVKTEEVATDGTIPEYIPAEKTGYTFVDWTYKDADGNIYTGTTMPAYDLYATANFTVNSYKVTYVVDGTELISSDVDFGGNVKATKPADDPSKTGSTFTGWADAEGKTPDDYESMPANDVTFNAQWTENDYTITYRYEDGTEIETFTLHYGDEIKVTGEEAEKAGYDFTGWVDDDLKTPDDYESMPAKNLEFVAQFEAADQPITYKVDGVVTTLEPATAKTDAEFTLAPLPVKEDYAYSDWTLEDGRAVPATMPAGGITVVTTGTLTTVDYIFDANGGQFADGDTTKTITVKATETLADAKTKLAEEPTRYGYTFEGWTAEGTTVTAQWKEIVKLVPANEDSTAMIERDGVVETYNTFTAADDKPYGVSSIIDPNMDTYTAEDYDSWYVYGLGLNLTVADLADYVKASGDGTYKVYGSDGKEAGPSDNLGTGLIIKVFDGETVVEQFYVVIFGDIDGDADLSVRDTGRIESEIALPSWSEGDTKVNYLVKAADVDLDGNLSVRDTGRIEAAIAGDIVIDQNVG